MSFEQTQTLSFLTELYLAVHDLSTDELRMALYTGDADLNARTEIYTAAGEVMASGYIPGGQTLTNVTVTPSDEGAYVSFDSPVWLDVDFIARGALVYNVTKAGKAIAVLDFGSDKQAGPNFTVTMPANTPAAALIRSTRG